MIFQFRPNLWVADVNDDLDPLKEQGATSIVVVDGDLDPIPSHSLFDVYKVGLSTKKMNAPHIKDLACHMPKYMLQSGEKVIIVDGNGGLQQAAFVACRLLCEVEMKSIYEMYQEMKGKVPEFDITKAYF